MKQKLLLLWLAIMTAITASAYDFSAVNDDGVTIYYNISDGNAMVTDNGSKSYSGDVVIPESVEYNNKTYPVTSIGYNSFYYCTGLSSVTIPNSVTLIDSYAFYKCTGLTSVTIPNSVTSICSFAFQDCTSLTEVTIPNSVTLIGDGAFSNTALYNDGSNWEDNVLYIGNHLIEANDSLAGTCTIKEGTFTIHRSAFSDCSSLTSVIIPNSVTLICDNAFKNCTGLGSVTIPDSVILIGSSAFENCTGLGSVTIPDSVISICRDAFLNTAFYNDDSNWEYNVLYIGNHLIEAKNSLASALTIKAGTLTIADWAFNCCRGLTSVTIPESVTLIGNCAFENCTGLGSVTIPDSVTSIGNAAFYGCSGLTSVTIPNSVTSIGAAAFYGCSGLTSMTIPNSVTSIGENAFEGCSSLSAVYISDMSAWYSIDFNTYNSNPLFYAHNLYLNSELVTELIVPQNLVSINKYAFLGCTNLTSVTIPNSVTSIGDGAFEYCSGLTSVTIPNSVTSIGVSAFNCCSGLTSVAIGNSVTSIGNAAFYGCSGLTSMTIPNSVTSIGYWAFFDCSGLTSVIIPNSVTSIGTQAFYQCSGLASVTVKNHKPSNISLGSSVFDGVPTSTCVLTVPLGSKDRYAAADQWSDFINREEYFSNIELTDGEAYTVSSDHNDVEVNYTRTFVPDVWQALYVPFNMSYDEWKDYATVAELACVHSYEDGRTIIEFVTVTGGDILPNVPYMIFPKTGDEITFHGTGKTLKAAPEEGTRYISCSSPRYIFKLFGNYQPISASTLAGYGDAEFNGAYVMTTNSKFQHPSAGSTLKPFRFYLTKEKNPNGYWNAPAKENAGTSDSEEDTDVIYLMIDGNISGIIHIGTENQDDDRVYDLMGRETNDPHNGIFIRNGKKIIIK